MKKNMKKNIISFLLILACIIGMPCTNLVDPLIANSIKNEIPTRMKQVAENEFLELYFDERETDIAVKVKKTNEVWFSNPVDIESDEKATAFYKKLMKSQLSVTYYNESVQSSEMNNYSDSIEEEQFEVEYLEDGLTIIYTLGEMAEKIILPQIISEERFLTFYNQMDQRVQKKVARNYTFLNLDTMKEKDKKTNLDTYPILNEHNIYVLKSSVKDYLKEELMEYFLEVGYTKEDMGKDHEENGFVAEDNKPWFTIPLTYRLDGESLIVSVDPSMITYNEDGYYLVDVEILEYFGAAGKQEEGYIFVPDGSGALIYLNNGKTNSASYSGKVYGQDLTTNAISNKKLEIDDSLGIKIPVFGLKSEDRAWLAIVEQGDAYADINAEIAGRTNSYNNVYAGFSYLSYGAISMGDMIGANSFQMYSEPKFTESYQIRYSFLSGAEADYSGMASYYRDYLVEHGILHKTEVKEELPFYIEFIGAIDKVKSIFGIKYNSIEALTTYAQALEIIEELESVGISNMKVQYSGWMKGGIESLAPIKAKKNSNLENDGMGLNEYIKIMGEKGFPLYFGVDLQYVYKDRLLDGYSANSFAPRYFDKSIVKTGRYLIPNGLTKDKDINMISPYYVERMAGEFMNRTSKYDLPGVAVGSLSSNLYSDFMSNRYTDRENAITCNTNAMSGLKGVYRNGILVNNANIYSLPYTTDLLEVPMDSNKLRLIDESIPFYEMVIRGYIEYAGEPLNMSDDFTTTLLKSVESGAGLYFKWIYEDNSIVKDTEYDYLYSINYEIWKDKAIGTYNKVNEVFNDLQGQCITKHEKLDEDVYQVTYEEGTKVIINYNKEAVRVNDVNIPAQDFAVVEVR